VCRAVAFPGPYDGVSAAKPIMCRFAINVASGTTTIGLGANETTIVACYCRGTLIRTARGETKVEELEIGDEITTASGAARPIKWIGRRSYGGRFVMGRTDILPICIKAGALDDNVPERDLWISPHHAMYFKDDAVGGVLIEAKNLVNGASIVQAERVEKVEYFHIELDSHDVIIAEGALSETFLDDDSRGMFHNVHEYDALYGRSAPRPRITARHVARTATRWRPCAAVSPPARGLRPGTTTSGHCAAMST
jgi:hypothetical protein